ncbi:MAG: hypothetical protein LAP87_16445 [Acidobacteriia bacterium]|nr:hypothetical protein [Terriglobia bacterium]
MRPADTSPEAWKVFIGLMSKMTPAEKLRRTMEYSEMIRLAGEAGLRQAYPLAGDREIFLRNARRRLGPGLFRRVYGAELQDDGSAQRSS